MSSTANPSPGSRALVWGCLPLLLGACFQIGPAHPETDGRAYLEAAGYPQAVIAAVVDRQSLPEPAFEELVAEHSADVRFLVAQNPSLGAALQEALTHDGSAFLRGGAATSHNLTEAQIERLSRDSSHTTRLYVARNPIAPEATLIRMHDEGLELSWFAMNPNCPGALIEKMRAEDDQDALHWLEVTRSRESPEGDP